MSSNVRQLISRLIPPARKQFEHLQAHRRDVVWGNTQITLRVRQYPKSKDERVSLVLPNWHRVRLWSETLRRKVELVMTNDTLRHIEDMGGLDAYLINTPESKLKSNPASAVKWEVMCALRRKEAAAMMRQGVDSPLSGAAAGAPGRESA
ncbi:hypothetical protein HYH02_010677 [Chlamydomonas schloesseri]|uniref:Mitochondrial ribosomal protein L28 n=1 Tax=Chlamydomonas schloesseri TaxID=2026947 RepID=A0A835T4V6_9CHLO|nr:hypothetical protein HYH02_010677 [Chlamydomonas schloesseri]|eukprot:KAG2438879.1 hypothetical protein HYH02_010677 [Chlamydomonas schloesseri]